MCEICGRTLSNQAKYGVCNSNKECLRENWRRRKQEERRLHPKRNSETISRYLKKQDRACKENDCFEYAIINAHRCKEHHRIANRNSMRRKYQQHKIKLAKEQNYICPWCEGLLPEDLEGTHEDHMWPKDKGGPDLEWNIRLLHGKCNGEKNAKLTMASWDVLVGQDVSSPVIMWVLHQWAISDKKSDIRLDLG